MMDDDLQAFVALLIRKNIDCVELDRTIEAAGDTDLSRVLWSLAYLRHTRDIELYKKGMSDECRQAIQRIADLCVIQAHTDVAPEAWDSAREAAVAAGQSMYSIAAYASAEYSALCAAIESAAESAWAAAESALAAAESAWAAHSAAAHYTWERDTLIALITELTK